MIRYLQTFDIEKAANLPSKSQMGIFSILLVIALVLSIRNYDSFQLGVYMDDASYAVLAQSIAFSDKYGLVNVPGKPESTRYPFGFPLLLSPFARLVPDNPDPMKLASLLATLLNSCLLFFGWPYLSQNKSYWWGLTIAALYLTAPLVVGHTRMVMSEPAFTTFVLAALILTEKFLSKGKQEPVQVLLLGGLAAFAVFVRTLGIVLWIAIVIRLLLTLPIQKSLKILGYLFIGGAVVVGAVVLLTPVSVSDLAPTEYTDQFQNPQAWGQVQIEVNLALRLWGGLRDYVRQHLREVIAPIGGGQREVELGQRLGISDLSLVTGLVVGSLIILGSFSFFVRKGVSPTAYIFAILYLGAILLWPWRGARFLYPILPFLHYWFLFGILIIADQVERFKPLSIHLVRLISQICLITVVTVMLLLSLYKVMTNNSHTTEYTRDLRVGTTWLRDNSPSDALIMAQQPQSVYLYSQRKTIGYPDSANFAELQKVIEDRGVDYILIAPKLEWRADGSLVYDEYTRNIFLPFVNKLTHMERLQLVYESEEDMVLVFQVLINR